MNETLQFDKFTVTNEIERRWLVNSIPNLGNAPFTEMCQVYAKGQGRLRREIPSVGETRFVLAIKEGTGLRREQREKLITESEFMAAFSETNNPRLYKRRYYLPHEVADVTHTIELDYFHDNITQPSLNGKYVAEIEFDTEENAESFTAVPEWFGTDVTRDNRYNSGQLAKHGWPGSGSSLL